MASTRWSFYLLKALAICTIFLHNWTECIDGFYVLLQMHIKKGNDGKNPAILWDFSYQSALVVSQNIRLKAE